MYPEDRKYSQDHEWVTEGETPARVGITKFAADALDEAVYVDLPEVGDEVEAGVACGEIESVKSVSDLVAPVSGTVTAINEALEDEPQLATSDPHGEGWLYEVEPSGGFDQLMSAADYEAFSAEEQ